MSATSASSQLTAASARTEPEWYLGGVAAAVAVRTRIPAGLLRFLIVCVSAKHFWAALGIYGAAALVVPHQGRWLPGWLNLVGARRAAILAGTLWLIPVGWDTQGVMGGGPALWVPVGGAALAAILMLLSEPRVDPLTRSAEEDRRTALSTLPALIVAVVVAGGVTFLPGLRSELVLALGLGAAGVAVAVLGPRISLSAAIVPLTLLGLTAVLLIASGARLQGGVGDLRVAPRAADALASVYRRATGELTLDLRDIRSTAGRTRTVTATVGVGRIRILLPAGARGTLDLRIGEGMADGLSSAGDGVFIRHVGIMKTYGQPSRVRYRIIAAVGKGCVIVLEPGASGSC